MEWPDEPLSRTDAANIQLDARDQVNVVLIAAQLRPGGFASPTDGPDLALLRSAIRTRLECAEWPLRRLSQQVGGDPRRPVWQSCRPDLSWHLRIADGYLGSSRLAELSAQLMTTPLPPDRPLWELLVVPGIGADPAGVILRLHHCVADGAGGVQLMQRLLGEAVSAPPPKVRASVTPARQSPVLAVRRIAALFSARIGPTPLLGRISQQRAVGFAQVDLTQLADGARRCGGTINDALLAAVGQGITAAFTDCGARMPTNVRVSVPVALPDRGTSGNATSVMVVDLPLAMADPAAAVSQIAAQTRTAKQSARTQGTFELTRSRWGTWLFARLARHQRFAAAFVTNVRGPSTPLSIGGAELAELWPVTPIQGNVRLGVAAMSYAGRLSCAVHVDASVLSASAFSHALQQGLDAIVGQS